MTDRQFNFQHPPGQHRQPTTDSRPAPPSFSHTTDPPSRFTPINQSFPPLHQPAQNRPELGGMLSVSGPHFGQRHPHQDWVNHPLPSQLSRPQAQWDNTARAFHPPQNQAESSDRASSLTAPSFARQSPAVTAQGQAANSVLDGAAPAQPPPPPRYSHVSPFFHSSELDPHKTSTETLPSTQTAPFSQLDTTLPHSSSMASDDYVEEAASLSHQIITQPSETVSTIQAPVWMRTPDQIRMAGNSHSPTMVAPNIDWKTPDRPSIRSVSYNPPSHEDRQRGWYGNVSEQPQQRLSMATAPMHTVVRSPNVPVAQMGNHYLATQTIAPPVPAMGGNGGFAATNPERESSHFQQQEHIVPTVESSWIGRSTQADRAQAAQPESSVPKEEYIDDDDDMNREPQPQPRNVQIAKVVHGFLSRTNPASPNVPTESQILETLRPNPAYMQFCEWMEGFGIVVDKRSLAIALHASVEGLQKAPEDEEDDSFVTVKSERDEAGAGQNRIQGYDQRAAQPMSPPQPAYSKYSKVMASRKDLSQLLDGEDVSEMSSDEDNLIGIFKTPANGGLNNNDGDRMTDVAPDFPVSIGGGSQSSDQHARSIAMMALQAIPAEPHTSSNQTDPIFGNPAIQEQQSSKVVETEPKPRFARSPPLDIDAEAELMELTASFSTPAKNPALAQAKAPPPAPAPAPPMTNDSAPRPETKRLSYGQVSGREGLRSYLKPTASPSASPAGQMRVGGVARPGQRSSFPLNDGFAPTLALTRTPVRQGLPLLGRPRQSAPTVTHSHQQRKESTKMGTPSKGPADNTTASMSATHAPQVEAPKPIVVPMDPSKVSFNFSFDPALLAAFVLAAHGTHPELVEPLNKEVHDVVKPLVPELTPLSDLSTLDWHQVAARRVAAAAGREKAAAALSTEPARSEKPKQGPGRQRKNESMSKETAENDDALADDEGSGKKKGQRKKKKKAPGGVDASNMGPSPEPGMDATDGMDYANGQQHSGPFRAPFGQPGLPGTPGSMMNGKGGAARTNGTPGRAGPPGFMTTPTNAPPFPIYECRWHKCTAKLHNLNKFRKHILKAHLPEAEVGATGLHFCLWTGCYGHDKETPANARAQNVPAAASFGPAYCFQQRHFWVAHIENYHVLPTAALLGPGPADGLTDQEASESYLSDSKGRIVTPKVSAYQGSKSAKVRGSANLKKALAVEQQVRELKRKVGPSMDLTGTPLLTAAMRKGFVDDLEFEQLIDSADGFVPLLVKIQRLS